MRFKHYPFCVEPLPNELAYSVMLRSAEAMGISLQAFLKRITQAKKEVSSSAISLSQRLDLYEDPEETYFHTTLPWHFVAWPYGMQQLAASNKISPYSIHETKRFVFTKDEPGLAWCPICFKEDKAAFGSAYFHVEHQYGGVTVCPKHGVRLNFCDEKRPEFDLDPETVIQGEPIEKDVAALAVKVAGTSMDEWIPLLNKVYKERDLLSGKGVRRKELKDFLGEYFSDTVFSDYVRFRNTTSDWTDHIPVIGFGPRKTVHPFRLALLCCALEIEAPKRREKMPEPLVCPACGSKKLARADSKLRKTIHVNCLKCGHFFEIENTVFDLYKTNQCTDEELLEQVAEAVRELESGGEEITIKKVKRLVNHSIDEKSTPLSYAFLKSRAISSESRRVQAFLKSVRKLAGRKDIPGLLKKNRELTEGFVSDIHTLCRLNENYLKSLEEENGKIPAQ